MKVVLGPYRNWIGPYQIAEKLLFWMDKHEDDRVHNFGTWLANDKHGEDSWLMKLCNWVQSHKHRQEYVRIDRYDHWNVDHTLAVIIAPLLESLKANKNSFGMIDDSDVPEYLRSTNVSQDTEHGWDELTEARYTWFLDELIWAFNVHKSDNEMDQFYDHGTKVKGENLIDAIERIKIDKVGLEAHLARKQHAFNLFGKYFQTLWD